MSPEGFALLRKPFPASAIGKLPKGNTTLDFAGHAAVTDRLLSVDPTWTWEPVAFDDTGLPAYDKAGGLWIRLTVCGVTRLGYGDGPDPKQRIGDAIRNAAMRFGVALDLWSRQELEGTDPNGGDAAAKVHREITAALTTGGRKAERGPLENDPWQTPPVVVETDVVWFERWVERLERVNGSPSEVRGMWGEMAEQHRVGKLSDGDRALAETLCRDAVGAEQPTLDEVPA